MSVIHQPFTSPLKPYQHESTMNKLTEYCYRLFSACAIQSMHSTLCHQFGWKIGMHKKSGVDPAFCFLFGFVLWMLLWLLMLLLLLLGAALLFCFDLFFFLTFYSLFFCICICAQQFPLCSRCVQAISVVWCICKWVLNRLRIDENCIKSKLNET